MKFEVLRHYDKTIAVLFGILTTFFLILAFRSEGFFTWAFERHQNQISWYIRPLFLVPFCYAAFKRSWTGISGTIFLLLTSMFWFSKPAVVSEQVQQFLKMEIQYLTGDWNLTKLLISLLVPLSLVALATAFWKRSLWFGLSVLVFIAIAKMTWSVVYAGETGKSIFTPAIVGLLVGIVFVYLGFRRQAKKGQ